MNKIKVEELIGSLLIYDLALPQTKNCKSIALKSTKELEVSDDENSSNNYIALIAQKFKNSFTNNKRNEKLNKNK